MEPGEGIASPRNAYGYDHPIAAVQGRAVSSQSQGYQGGPKSHCDEI
jgi:hypothetical protein